MIDDDKLQRSYRDLPPEEPPEALDRAILASARKALEPPRARRQWAVPVSVAAVLVLALGITLRMQREEPGVETSVPSSPPAMNVQRAPSPPAQEIAVAPPAAPERAETAQRIAREQKPAKTAAPKVAPLEKKAMRADREEASSSAKDLQERNVAPVPQAAPSTPAEPAPPAAAVPSSPAAAAAPAPAPAMRAKREAQGFAADSAKEAAVDPFVKELERIAQLRREGRDAEADQALEKFRKDNPRYKIPDALWDQVKPR